jgi:hypothetical protein
MSLRISKRIRPINSVDAGEFIGIYIEGIQSGKDAKRMAKGYLEGYLKSFHTNKLKYIDPKNYKMTVKYLYLKVDRSGRRNKLYFSKHYYPGNKMVTVVLYD